MTIDPNFLKTLEEFQNSKENYQIPESYQKTGNINGQISPLNINNDTIPNQASKTSTSLLNKVTNVSKKITKSHHIKEVGASVIATVVIDFAKFLSESGFDFNKLLNYTDGNHMNNAFFALASWIISYCLIRLRLRPIALFQKVVENTQTKNESTVPNV